MNRYYFTLTKGKRPHHKCDNDIGVYGIYIDDELVYIGGTGRGFLSRYSTHKSNIKTKNRILYNKMHKALKENKDVYLKPLVICSDKNELSLLEQKYIEKYQPIYNLQGTTMKYRGI